MVQTCTTIYPAAITVHVMEEGIMQLMKGVSVDEGTRDPIDLKTGGSRVHIPFV